MTNAIEQTRREMYSKFRGLYENVMTNQKSYELIKKFESALEEHLEGLRKAMLACNESTAKCAQHSAEAFVDLESRLAAMTEERDTLRSKLQALQMASSTAAEVIRGLRSELEEAREVHDEQILRLDNQRQTIADLHAEKGQASMLCQHSFRIMHEHCIYCGVRK